MKGYVQVYTGNGKGKTTAAVGLAVRAAGAGLTVYIAQFVKGMHYSELDALARLEDRITVKQHGRTCFIRCEPEPADVEAARAGLAEVEEILASGRYDVVILDEATIAVHFGLFGVDDLARAVRRKPASVEVVITGRNAPPEIVEMADLVTEMVEVKHYYQAGVQARAGIES